MNMAFSDSLVSTHHDDEFKQYYCVFKMLSDGTGLPIVRANTLKEVCEKMDQLIEKNPYWNEVDMKVVCYGNTTVFRRPAPVKSQIQG